MEQPIRARREDFASFIGSSQHRRNYSPTSSSFDITLTPSDDVHPYPSTDTQPLSIRRVSTVSTNNVGNSPRPPSLIIEDILREMESLTSLYSGSGSPESPLDEHDNTETREPIHEQQNTLPNITVVPNDPPPPYPHIYQNSHNSNTISDERPEAEVPSQDINSHCGVQTETVMIPPPDSHVGTREEHSIVNERPLPVLSQDAMISNETLNVNSGTQLEPTPPHTEPSALNPPALRSTSPRPRSTRGSGQRRNSADQTQIGNGRNTPPGPLPPLKGTPEQNHTQHGCWATLVRFFCCRG